MLQVTAITGLTKIIRVKTQQIRSQTSQEVQTTIPTWLHLIQCKTPTSILIVEPVIMSPMIKTSFKK